MVSNGSSKSAASTLLNVVRSCNASDAIEFSAKKRNLGSEDKNCLVIDSTMTPLEAATLLWEHKV